MRTLARIALLSIVVVTVAASPLPLPTSPPQPAPKPVTDDYFGTEVIDPYRYFENLQDPTVKQYFTDQNDYTRAILARLDPAREQLYERIKALDNQGVSVSGVNLVGNRFFYEQLKPGESDPKLYVRTVGAASGRMLVDPDRLATKTRQHYTISYFLPSLDGRYVTYGIAEGGSENSVLHVVDATTGRVLPDTITRAKFVGATGWRPDGRSFYYLRFPALKPGTPQTESERRPVAYLHILGRNPDKDTPIFGYGVNPKIPLEPDDFSFITYSPASPYAIAGVEHGVQNELSLWAAPLPTVTGPRAPWRKLVEVSDDVIGFDVRGRTIYLVTHKNAPRYKVVAMDILHPDFAAARSIVPPSGLIVEQVGVARDALYVRERDGGLGRILRIVPKSDGSPESSTRISLPYDGAIDTMATDPRVDGAVFGLTGWMKSLLYYAVASNGSVYDTKIKPPSPVDASAYTSTEELTTSADGTKIPISIMFKKGIALDGSHPTYLEGYGAYGITIEPYFSTTRLAWLERSGVYAVCHVRGGGWYGDEWHRAGMKATKQHTIDDFIACAKYLIEKGYTAPAHLAGEGTSAGGILIGGAITQRPDLFAAALDEVGVSDALRSEFSPNGPPNIPEFGSVKTKPGFEALYKMDAYQHVKDGTAYPAVMLVTGMNDPRVSPWEPAKFAARLQAASTSGRPVLLWVGADTGHGLLFASREQTERLLSDEYGFLLWQLGDPAFSSILPIGIKSTPAPSGNP